LDFQENVFRKCSINPGACVFWCRRSAAGSSDADAQGWETLGQHFDENDYILTNIWQIVDKAGRQINKQNIDEMSTKIRRALKDSLNIHISIYPYIPISTYPLVFLLIHINDYELTDGFGPHENSPKHRDHIHIGPPRRPNSTVLDRCWSIRGLVKFALRATCYALLSDVPAAHSHLVWHDRWVHFRAFL